MVVIGGSRGVGRQDRRGRRSATARACSQWRDRRGRCGNWRGRSRRRSPVARRQPGGAPAKVFDVLQPDILVLGGGAFPPAAPLHEQTWQEFAVNWETDVKIAFHFCKAALSRPLPRDLNCSDLQRRRACGVADSGGYAGDQSARSCSSRTTVRRNRIVSASACVSGAWRRASCRTPISANMRSRGLFPLSRHIRG